MADHYCGTNIYCTIFIKRVKLQIMLILSITTSALKKEKQVQVSLNTKVIDNNLDDHTDDEWQLVYKV